MTISQHQTDVKLTCRLDIITKDMPECHKHAAVCVLCARQSSAEGVWLHCGLIDNIGQCIVGSFSL